MGLLAQDPDVEEIDAQYLPSTLGSVLGATASQAFDDAPLLSSIPKAVELDLARTRYAWTQKKFTHDEAKAYVEGDLGLPSDWLDKKDYNKMELDILGRRKREELARRDILGRDPGGFLRGSARLATALGVSVLDPINVASAFIPVISQERYAALLARQSSALGRAGVRVGVGAAEGAVGAAAIEPLTYAVHEQEMADYTMADSLINVGFGGVFGSVLHVGAGAIGDVAARGRLQQIDQTLSAAESMLADADAAASAAPRSAADLGPDPFAARSAAERVRESPALQEELRALKSETGWDTVGGRMIRATEDQSSPDYATVVGRTSWLPRADWWNGRPGGFNETRTNEIIEKAISGGRLGKNETAYLEYLAEIADERVKSRTFAPTKEELDTAGLDGTRDDAFETAMVSRALEIDENAIERLAIKHEDDDAGFLAAVKEFLNERDKNAPARGGGETSGGAQAEPATAVRQLAEASKTTRDAVFQTAIAQTLSDQPIKVDGLMRIDGDRIGAADAIRADAEHAANPDNSPLAEPEAVRAVDEQTTAIKANPLAQATAEMDEAEALLRDAMATLGDMENIPADLRADLDAAREFAGEVDSMSEAASMLVQCAMRHAQ
ncbi:MAG: hypothetical protein AB7F22_17760 [Reyranella sp.]|uniref:hypothetical protein n=1 Tax=Reyranella sp. TaxID=1929291 RepID=UPI003D0BF800